MDIDDLRPFASTHLYPFFLFLTPISDFLRGICLPCMRLFFYDIITATPRKFLWQRNVFDAGRIKK